MSSEDQSTRSSLESAYNNDQDENHNKSNKKSSFQHELSRYNLPLITVVPPLHRATHSDVLCISNNGIRKDYDKHKPLSKSCQLPYGEIYASNQSRRRNKKKIRHQNINNKCNLKPSTALASRSKKCHSKETLLLHEKHALDSRNRLDKQLHDEHRAYMSNLKKDREERYHLETKAALVIQKVVRGFRVRLKLFPERYGLWMNKKGVVFTEDEILIKLFDAANKIGISPKEEYFLGFALPRKFQL